ncbi:hypothetical protein GCM10009630_41940 [Kribbella jejuensis]
MRRAMVTQGDQWNGVLNRGRKGTEHPSGGRRTVRGNTGPIGAGGAQLPGVLLVVTGGAEYDEAWEGDSATHHRP